MSVRAAITKIVRHGRQVLQGVGRQKAGAGKAGQVAVKCEGQPRKQAALLSREAALQQLSTSHIGRSVLLRNLQSCTYKSLAAELRKEAAQRLSGNLYGKAYQISQLARSRLSIYAFVALGFAAHHTSTDDDPNYDSICEGIKSLFDKKRPEPPDRPIKDDCVEPCLSTYEMGPFVAKGCNAAVHLAREKHQDVVPIMDDTSPTEEEDDFEILNADDDDITSVILDDISSNEVESINTEEMSPEEQEEPDSLPFDLAIKMMFNYSVASDATAILQEMENETVPAQMNDSFMMMDMWENGNHVKKKRLKSHPNIVEMHSAFVDDTPQLPEAATEYPLAQPSRINPDGLGRNKTLFTVMKRYDMTLHEYLQTHNLTWFESTCLLTQLVEAVAHLNQHNIAHRDLKSNNILLELQEDGSVPHLVLSDFGHCLQSTSSSLQIPYTHNSIIRGGNPCLMAPEIKCSKPSPASYLDYSKADIWAVGAIAYELNGCPNPFYYSRDGTALASESYRDSHLPQLPDDVPNIVKAVIHLMLKRSPSERITANEAADMLNFILWSPREWLEQTAVPSKVKVMRSLLVLTAEVLLERPIQSTKSAICMLKQTFLARMEFEPFNKAVERLFGYLSVA